MTGALSTLGLGSQGVLTNDLLDKLKDADKASMVTPIERNQEQLKLKKAGLVGLKDAMGKLSDISIKLSDPAMYLNTKSEVKGDSVSIESSANVKSQTINIDVEKLATRDILSSYKKFENKDELFGAGNMTLDIDGNSYTINISDTDTVGDVAQKISDSTDGKIQASLLNVGGDEPFRLVMKSTDTGTKNAITVNADISFRHPAGGKAQDAQIRMDGIIIKRSSNEFDDLVEGVKLTLDKVGKSTVEISQDSGKISETMQSFVTQYNEILDSVATLTNYDPDTKNAGVFQGSSEIRNMMGALKDIFSTTISSAGKMSSDFGLSADKKGKLTFDKDTFELALGKDTKAIQNFFVGEGANEGIFRKMDGEIFNIKTNSSGVFKTLQSNYDSKERTLTEALERAQKRLDSKYEIMQKRFASYDAVIGRLSSASTMLTSLIDAQSPK